MNQTPPVTGGAAGQWAYGLQSDRIAASAASISAKAQQDATDNRIAAQGKLYALLGINGQPGLLQSVDQRENEVAWIDGEHRANREIQRNLVQGMGNAQAQQINSDFGAAMGTSMARLESRGLGSSSMTTDALNQNAAGRSQAFLNLESELLGAQMNVETQSNANITGAMENQLLRRQEDKALKNSYAGLVGSIWS